MASTWIFHIQHLTVRLPALRASKLGPPRACSGWWDNLRREAKENTDYAEIHLASSPPQSFIAFGPGRPVQWLMSSHVNWACRLLRGPQSQPMDIWWCFANSFWCHGARCQWAHLCQNSHTVVGVGCCYTTRGRYSSIDGLSAASFKRHS